MQKEYLATRKTKTIKDCIIAFECEQKFTPELLPLLEKWGYNVLISLQHIESTNLKCFVKYALEYSLLTHPYHPHFKQQISHMFKDVNSHVFYESCCHAQKILEDPETEIYTKQDLYQKELEIIESCLSTSQQLIFFLPRQSPQKIIEWLCKVSGPKTYIAYEGQFFPPTKQDSFLSVINVGPFDAEGNWPCFPYDTFDAYSLMKDITGSEHVIMRSPIFNNKEFINLTLQCFGQFVKFQKSYDFLLTNWIKATYGQGFTEIWLKALKKCRHMVLSLGIIKDTVDDEEIRIRAEILLNEIILIQKQTLSVTHLANYTRIFAKDIRNLLIDVLHKKNIPLVNLIR